LCRIKLIATDAGRPIIDEGFLALDDSLRITAINKAAERMLDRRREDTVAKKLIKAFPRLRGSMLHE
jgi:sensor histidine kinase regulating citrate/malate metabolism